MRTLPWTYLGWRRFPRDLSTFEVRRFFSFTASDRRERRVRFPVRGVASFSLPKVTVGTIVNNRDAFI